MTQNKTIGAHEVCTFLAVPYQTFNQWLIEGVLGVENPNPGRGRSRRFNREDVAVSVVVKEVLGAGGTFERAKTLAHGFRQHLKGGSASEVLLLPREGDTASFVISFDDVQKTIDDLQARSVLFIPLDKILREVDELFAGQEAETVRV